MSSNKRDIYIKPRDWERVKRAAELQGLSASAFVCEAARRRSQYVLGKHRRPLRMRLHGIAAQQADEASNEAGNADDRSIR